MNEWRRALNSLLAREETPRKPALRRSRRPEWLYTTDLPGLISDEALTAFQRRAEAAGWICEAAEGWLEMTRSVSTPPAGWFDGPWPPEASCCASLLQRHFPDGRANDSGKTACRAGRPRRDDSEGRECENREAIALIKAGEQGAEAYEKACAEIHREWAARLRRREPLPALDPAFFGNDIALPGDSGDEKGKERNQHAF